MNDKLFEEIRQKAIESGISEEEAAKLAKEIAELMFSIDNTGDPIDKNWIESLPPIPSEGHIVVTTWPKKGNG